MPGQRSQSSYRVLRRLATGGMAEVFLAESEGVAEFHKTVAIKRVLPHLASNTRFVRMFLDEARLAAKLMHRNIVQVFDVGRVEEQYFLVMEYVDGTTVREVLEHLVRAKRRIPVNIAVYIAIEMCNGLDYAHNVRDPKGGRLGVVHRDVSPANVLVSRHGGVRIMDFGLAKAASQAEKTDPGVVKGKYGYLAPETASGEEADAKADQFAAAIVLWEMLAGRRLFQAETNLDTVKLVREAKVPHLDVLRTGAPDALDRVLARALAKNKNDRFDSCAAMSRALTEILFEYRLAVSAQDVIALVSEIVGADTSGANAAAKRDNAPETPDPEHRFHIRSVVDGALNSPPEALRTKAGAAHGAESASTPAHHETDEPELRADDGDDAAARAADRPTPKARAADDSPAAESTPEPAVSQPPPRPERRRGRGVSAFFVMFLAAAAGAGLAVRDRTHVMLLWQRVVTRARSFHLPISDAPAAEHTTVANLAAPPIGSSLSADAQASRASAATQPNESAPSDTASLPRHPSYMQFVALTHAIDQRIPACVQQFGHHNRHARLEVTYDGRDGSATDVQLVDRYFVDHPIGECIRDAVRAEHAPRFADPTWSTGFVFMVR